MPRIAPLDPTAAEGRAKRLLDGVQAQLGATPAMMRTMARSAVLDGYLALGTALRRGSIGAADGERIALAVAEANRCAYCLSAHTYLGTEVAGLDPLEIRRARSFESAEARSAAILAFAEAVVRGRGAVADAAFAAAREAGLTDAELSDIVGHVAVNVLSNYFNRAFEVEVDFPLVEPADAHAAAA